MSRHVAFCRVMSRYVALCHAGMLTRPQPREAEATTHEAEATTHEAKAEATTHEAEATTHEAEATTHEAEANRGQDPTRDSYYYYLTNILINN